jgi:hypothetical protein
LSFGIYLNIELAREGRNGMRSRFLTIAMAFIGVFLCAAVPCPLWAHVDFGTNDGTILAPLYAQQVDRRLDIPESEQRAYAELLAKDLAAENSKEAQYVVLVDRNKFVQAAMIYWMSPDRIFHFIGASPVSTGKPGTFEHFITPTGVFTPVTMSS